MSIAPRSAGVLQQRLQAWIRQGGAPNDAALVANVLSNAVIQADVVIGLAGLFSVPPITQGTRPGFRIVDTGGTHVLHYSMAMVPAPGHTITTIW